MTCAGCGSDIAGDALSCPACQRLVHAGKLEELAAVANASAAKKRWAEAGEAWREALELLPAETKQFAIVSNKLAELDQLQAAAEADKKGALKWVAALGPVGFFLWKFKVIILLILSKGKLLLLGLTKLSTLSTMLLSMGFYWSLYGWWFAAGLVLSIYVHEMGHVWELRKFGVAASAPMFIPGLGAVILSKTRAATVGQDARIGLAGPVWGTAAALVCVAGYVLTRHDFWVAMARWGAWINLFNLVPVWQLDGGWAFNSLTRRQRGICLGAVLLMWFVTGDAVFFLVALGAGYRMFSNDFPESGDTPVMARFLALVVVLGVLCLLPAGR